jgi:hypothetical protein
VQVNSQAFLTFTLDKKWVGDRELESQQVLGIFLFTTTSRMALGPTQPPIKQATGTLSLGVKRPGREVDYSHPSSS